LPIPPKDGLHDISPVTSRKSDTKNYTHFPKYVVTDHNRYNKNYKAANRSILCMGADL